MSQSTASKLTGQKSAAASTPVTIAQDQNLTNAEQRMLEMLGRIYTELRVMNRLLQVGLNVTDDPDRSDPEFQP